MSSSSSSVRGGSSPRRRRELDVEKRRHLARHAVDGEQVRSVVAGLEHQHLVGQRQDVGQRRPGLDAVRKDHDPGVVRAEVDLVLGEDHPVAHLAAHFAPLETQAVGQHRARQCDADRRAGAEVPGAADDLARVTVPHVDVAQLQPVGVRVLGRLEHAADPEQPEIAVDVGDPDGLDRIDLARRDDEALGDLLDRDVDRDVFAQPRDGDSHQNCLRTRRSFSQNIRMSGIPCRCAAMRSRPRPQANPDHSSGS